ncbi:MAG: hypothetical protein KAW88_01630 [Candidatus Cloacimonetes bacterium]|nr:hypothetical protein [Candidatus Cloacimonadota bacterium]
MNKIILILILFLFLSSLIAENELTFSSVNEFEYIYRDRRVEYRNYFSNKLSLQMQYKMFRLGLKYDLYHPKHDKFLDIDNILIEEDIPGILDDFEKNKNYFDEYFIQIEDDNFFVNSGTYEAVIGSGIVTHNYYDEDFDEDSRLTGILGRLTFDRWQMQTFYGIMENEDDEEKNDKITALDFEFNITENLETGFAYLMHLKNQENQNFEKDFSQRDILSGRLNYQTDLFDISCEYAESNEYDRYDNQKIDGRAFYSNLTTYLDKFTFISAYKNYENFDVRISDLPTANHSEEPLDDSWQPGYDEEGLMGEIRFVPNFENEFVFNYSEGWSSDFKVRQSDFYTEFKHEFENLTFKAEYSHLEQMNKLINNWKKELTPILSIDFITGEFPILIKAEYQYKEKEQGTSIKSHYEPKLQADISYKNYSLSLIVEIQIGDSDDGEDGDFWIGGEFAATILGSTDIRIFAGKEKGGKVCRNGVCRYQSEFEGVRIEITTSF